MYDEECFPNDKDIEIGCFVVIKENINGIEKNAVGIVRQITLMKVDVFFIGSNISTQVDKSQLVYLDIKKTGKPRQEEPYKMKVCNVCHILKNYYDDFDINQTDAQGRKTTRPSCHDCRIKIDGTPLDSKEKERLQENTPKHTFTCPICKKTTIPGVTANLVIDHDHNTGAGREWICDSCNTGLGRFKDDVVILQRAIDYLRKYLSS